MKVMRIYEPAMCCETGLCGVDINNPELVRMSLALKSLKQNGIKYYRYNLSGAPHQFVANTIVKDKLGKDGIDCLPLTLIDEEIVIEKRYPTNQEIADFIGIDISLVAAAGNDDGEKKEKC